MSKLPSNKVRTSIWLPEELKEQLIKIAEHNRMTFSSVIVFILEEYIKENCKANKGAKADRDGRLEELIAKIDDIHRMTKSIHAEMTGEC